MGLRSGLCAGRSTSFNWEDSFLMYLALCMVKQGETVLYKIHYNCMDAGVLIKICLNWNQVAKTRKTRP